MRIKAQSPRLVIWLASAFTSLVCCGLYAWVTDSFTAAPIERVSLFLIIGLAMFGLVFIWPDRLSRKAELGLLFGLAVLLRLALLPTAPSDDIYRYVWEGHLVTQGISPYQATAESAIFEAHRDTMWERMNNKDKFTAYPPLTILSFAVLSALCPEPWFFKLVFVIVDLGVIGLIILLQRKHHAPLRWVGLYAFNPVVLISFAAEGHFDVLMVFTLVATALALHYRRLVWAGIALACAVHIKVIAVLGIPFLWARGGWRAITAGAVVGTVAAIPFLNDLPNLIEGILAFGSDRSFNGFFHDQLHALFNSRGFANRVVYALLFAVFIWRFVRSRDEDWEVNWLWVCGALIVLSPTLHFWYLSWLLPFMAIRPRLSWIAFSVSQAGYFLVWKRYNEEGIWDLSTMESFSMWIHLGFWGIYEARFWWKRGRSQIDQSFANGISVIIPTLNASEHLPNALKSLKKSSLLINEIIVSDAGSEDTSRVIAQENGADIVESRPGRGTQIAAGIAKARYETAIILHADSVLPIEAAREISQVLKLNPDTVGGVLGQRFDRQTLFLTFIEMLNEMRATLGGTGFGDQIHFINLRKFSPSKFPVQPLMEDVELSLRMMNAGQFKYLGHEGIVSAKKWKAGKQNTRFWLVIRILAAYRWARLFSQERAAKLSEKLFKIYYKS